MRKRRNTAVVVAAPRCRKLKRPEKVLLLPLDMAKSENWDHPDVIADEETQYLVLSDNQFLAGVFSRDEDDDEDHKLMFDPADGTNWLDFNKPGYNGSKWQAIWEIITR